MKLSMFKPTDPTIPIFFNIESSVGRHGQNSKPEDIQLVQFLLKKNGEKVPIRTSEGGRIKRILQQVPVTGALSDRDDDPTIIGIKTYQQAMAMQEPGTVVDGRVSPANHYRYSSGYFTIVDLNWRLRVC